MISWIKFKLFNKNELSKKAQFAKSYCEIRKVPYQLLDNKFVDHTALILDRIVVSSWLENLSYHDIIDLIDTHSMYSTITDEYTYARRKYLDTGVINND